MTREELIQVLSDWIARARCCKRALLVAIDGIDLSGKTRLTTELADALEKQAEKVAIIHGDDFLNTRAVRYRRGEFSSLGFFDDFFDYKCLKREILEPARASKSVVFEKPVIHEENDSILREVIYQIDARTVVLVEGLFLLRLELRDCFDLVIRLKIPGDLVIARAMSRDVPRLGNRQRVMRHYSRQVLPAHDVYEQACKPDHAADLILDTSDVNQPQILESKIPSHVAGPPWCEVTAGRE